ncbi:MAG: class I SAM-dependent methyltransferase [Allosphingosinicella sp.]
MALADRLRRLIAAQGPIPVSDYMALANAHYYATRDPFGADGDFVTAPEISQMFGELVGLCLADVWDRAGRPEGVRYVELGPGRGTLAADALRAMRAASLVPKVHFVETSPVLRRAQADRVPGAHWHDDLGGIPEDGPILAVANEFFDALPARQLVAGAGGWRERMVGLDGEHFSVLAGPPIPGSAIPEPLRAAPPGTLIETSPASAAIVRMLADRLKAPGGCALVIDYGHERTSLGETLQSVRRHAPADPWMDPGERDLTVHVDFEALSAAAAEAGVTPLGPVEQGRWLRALGIEARSAALARAAPGRSGEIEAALGRLTAAAEMGSLFKVMAMTAPGWPVPGGFQ